MKSCWEARLGLDGDGQARHSRGRAGGAGDEIGEQMSLGEEINVLRVRGWVIEAGRGGERVGRGSRGGRRIETATK